MDSISPKSFLVPGGTNNAALCNCCWSSHWVAATTGVTTPLGEIAADPRIDALRDKMEVRENEQFTTDYRDPQKRYVGNAVQVFFGDGTSTERVEISVPIGHRERREEGIAALQQKFADSVSPKLAAGQWQSLHALCADRDRLAATAVDDFVALLVA